MIRLQAAGFGGLEARSPDRDPSAWAKQEPKDTGVYALDTRYIVPLPRIDHPDNWLSVNPDYLLVRAERGKSKRFVL